MAKFKIGNVEVGPDGEFFLLAGPCVIESMENCLEIAEKLAEIGKSAGVPVIFKASFDKANRSSIDSFRGPGVEKGLEILSAIAKETSMPVVTDIHEASQAPAVAKVVDCLQIPAFLCRQTDLLVAAAKASKPVSVKKGQFVSPQEMKNVVEKIRNSGNDKIMLTERGTFFGYNRLVNDMTSIETMKQLGVPVVFDATHSTQRPGGLGSASGGVREYAPILARSAIAAGANGLFLEVHTDPAAARCDAESVMPIEWVEGVVSSCKEIFEIVRG